MATDDSEKSFACILCDFAVNYHYKGRNPPFAKSILLLEDCFITKDPFSTTGGYISVGGICSLCGNSVCMSHECSLFYTQRFCMRCAGENLKEFPLELQKEICEKLKT